MRRSRAEYRLRLRADNADQRLTALGRSVGTVNDQRWGRFVQKREALASLARLCRNARVNGSALEMWVRRPDVDVPALASAIAGVTDEVFCTDVLWQTLVEARYEGYARRQDRQIERFRRLESMRIPDGVDYSQIAALRIEAREQLARVGPRTMGQASRLPGVNPADLTVLWVTLRGRPNDHLVSPSQEKHDSRPKMAK